ncbi:hypothetical protein GLYMA_18G243600v4 [Glycine max]|uniref:Uncharacterized protein n=1 Tax=Glycine max TaxID=3847 RepID=I1N403_SOYBN|nr:hypothetical protein GYH30_050988 [Glycine max]KRH00944.1 hypothetical protein GLYMA_18G243600v4 [Glycine max]
MDFSFFIGCHGVTIFPIAEGGSTSACGHSNNGIPGVFALVASDLFLLAWIIGR